MITIDAEPCPVTIDPDRTALIIIDMQRDFLEPGGFGDSLGNDLSQLTRTIGPIKALLGAARRHRLLVIHTREGHRPDLSDAPQAKIVAQLSFRYTNPQAMIQAMAGVTGTGGVDGFYLAYPIGSAYPCSYCNSADLQAVLSALRPKS